MIAAVLPSGPAQLVGIGDDAAVLRAPDGRVVASTDLLVEGRHFRRDWTTAHDLGCAAAARNLADIAAMGALPTALLVGLALPGSTAVDWVLDLARGLGEEAARTFTARLRVFKRATSLGSVESLAEHRASVEGPGTMCPADLVRLSIGIEHVGDLIGDIEEALQ